MEREAKIIRKNKSKITLKREGVVQRQRFKKKITEFKQTIKVKVGSAIFNTMIKSRNTL